MSANLILKLESAIQNKLDVTYNDDHILIKMGVIFGTDLIKIARILNQSKVCKHYYVSGVEGLLNIKIFTKMFENKMLLSYKLEDVMAEAIEMFYLKAIETDPYFVRYTNGAGLDIRIWATDVDYKIEINNHTHTEVPEDLLNDLIITELQIP